MASDLRLDWVGHAAAHLACHRWHYSRAVPAGKCLHIGVWEDRRFIGVITFSRGANTKIGLPYSLSQLQVCELTRVALDKHQAPVSRMVAIALRLVRRQCPEMRLVVSYAAVERGHYGGIYQAGGWVYTGPAETYAIRLHGQIRHARTISSKFGHARLAELQENVDPNAERVDLVRHKYLMPLDEEMRAQITGLAQAFPKRA